MTERFGRLNRIRFAARSPAISCYTPFDPIHMSIARIVSTGWLVSGRQRGHSPRLGLSSFRLKVHWLRHPSHVGAPHAERRIIAARSGVLGASDGDEGE